MSKKEEAYDPTDEEVEAIERAALNAASEVLKSSMEDGEFSVHACLRAFAAARLAVRDATADLLDAHPPAGLVMCHPRIALAVASAVATFEWATPADNVKPNSLLGCRVLTYARAAIAMNAMQTLKDCREDDDGFLGEGEAYDVLEVQADGADDE